MSAPLLHRPPRRPRAWAWLFGTSQLAVVALWIWAGWHWGLPALLLTHAAMVWGTLKPQSRLFGPVLTRLPVDEPAAWLTIDDGPSADTQAILDLLDAHHARATFFLVAARAQARPALVREIVRRGHTIGNHSLDHPSARFWMLGPRALARQIGEAQAVLAGLAGQPPRWFRAVVGMANPFVGVALKRHGLARVAWCARGFDTVEQDPAIVVTRLEGGLRPGAIVLLHEGAAHGRSVETMAAWLRRMDELGYRSVLPDALEAR